MDEADRNALCEELAALEAAEARVSAERRRLHQQMEYSGSESLRSREQEVSAERRELHQRIDALQVLLGIERTAEVLARKRAAPVRELSPEIEPERPEFLTDHVGGIFARCPYCDRWVDPNASDVVYAVKQHDFAGTVQKPDFAGGKGALFHSRCSPEYVGYVRRPRHEK